MNNIFFVLFLISSCMCAQIISPELVSSSGNTMKSGNYILCSSLGEISIPTITQNQHILTQGFHQEEITTTTVHISPQLPNHSIKLFPNPIRDDVSISISGQYTIAHTSIKNINGSTIKNFTLEPFKCIEKISLQNLSQGVYFIEFIIDAQKPIIYQIYKI